MHILLSGCFLLLCICGFVVEAVDTFDPGYESFVVGGVGAVGISLWFFRFGGEVLVFDDSPVGAYEVGSFFYFGYTRERYVV